ncbi:MAG: fluoride efflux transporter CrcB [Chitinophagales bacterium]|nr:fluoride efflux transporter CrcB [Chitinophagales bacterium]
MRILLLVGAGGFIGSVLRYLAAQFVQNKFLSAFPFGTLSVNVIGCFAIGIIFALAEKGNLSAEWRLFLATGICGGFTTFSAFSIETISLMKEGQMTGAFLYILASIALGLGATFLGIVLVKLF